MNCPLKTGRGIGDAAGLASEVFIAYGSRTLSPADETALRQHMALCTECRHMAEAQREVWSVLDTWSPARVTPNFDERLYARIAAEQQRPWWDRVLGNFNQNWSSKPAMPVALACTALLGAFLLKSPVAEHQPQAGVQSSVDSRVDIEQVERALDDMDMLKQLGVVSTYSPGQPSRPENL